MSLPDIFSPGNSPICSFTPHSVTRCPVPWYDTAEHIITEPYITIPVLVIAFVGLSFAWRHYLSPLQVIGATLAGTAIGAPLRYTGAVPLAVRHCLDLVLMAMLLVAGVVTVICKRRARNSEASCD